MDLLKPAASQAVTAAKGLLLITEAMLPIDVAEHYLSVLHYRGLENVLCLCLC